jgi:hypothetical protein
MSGSPLEDEADRATALLRGRTVKRVWRRRIEEVGLEFEDGARLYVENHDESIEVSITGCDDSGKSHALTVTKNIQVVDGALNCVYDVFAASEDDYLLLFPNDSDIAFVEDFEVRPDIASVTEALKRLWAHRVPKAHANGIHGTLFYGLSEKRQFYPTRRDEEAMNPDGTKLRG